VKPFQTDPIAIKETVQMLGRVVVFLVASFLPTESGSVSVASSLCIFILHPIHHIPDASSFST
jgi:hypothetical protein